MQVWQGHLGGMSESSGSGDEYSTERVEYMVRMLAGANVWVFSNVCFVE